MQKVLGYAAATAILLLVADVAPTVATATTTLILLAVAISHADQIKAVGDFIQNNTGLPSK